MVKTAFGDIKKLLSIKIFQLFHISNFTLMISKFERILKESNRFAVQNRPKVKRFLLENNLISIMIPGAKHLDGGMVSFLSMPELHQISSTKKLDVSR